MQSNPVDPILDLFVRAFPCSPYALFDYGIEPGPDGKPPFHRWLNIKKTYLTTSEGTPIENKNSPPISLNLTETFTNYIKYPNCTLADWEFTGVVKPPDYIEITVDKLN